MIAAKSLGAIALLAVGVLIGGCATPSAPVVATVKIPVAEKCASPMPIKPAFAVDALEIGAPIDRQMRALRAERQQRIGYEIKLEAAAAACR